MAARVRCDLTVDLGIGNKCQRLLTNATATLKSTSVDLLSMLEEETVMHLIQPDPASALLGLRALKTIASAAGPVGPAQRAMMEAAQKVILRTNADIDALAPVTPAELAKGFAASPGIRHQFANGMIW